MSRIIGVVGSGTMGQGIAQVFAQAGHSVTLLDTSVERADAGKVRIAAQLKRQVDKQKLDQAAADSILNNIATAADYNALSTASLVIEAVFEDLATKRAVIEAVGEVSSADAIFATNTSSISITQLASYHPNPARFAGMHFFNPVPVLPLVEVIRAEQSSPETVATLLTIATEIGKTAVEVADVPGFVVNRLLIPMINEAIICLETGVASRESIDQTMKLGAAHPMGPLELADLIGLDVVLSIMEVLHRDLGEDKYRPAVSLRRMVAAGKLGRKSGEGFYVHQ